MSNSAYVGIEALATYFGVSASTIRQWVRTGKIPRKSYIKIGLTYRFHFRAVEDALLNYKDRKGLTDAERDDYASAIITSLEEMLKSDKPFKVPSAKLEAAEAELESKVTGKPNFKPDAELDKELADIANLSDKDL